MINALKKIAHKKNEKMRYKLHAQSCPMKTFIKFRKKGREEVENIGKRRKKKAKMSAYIFRNNNDSITL